MTDTSFTSTFNFVENITKLFTFTFLETVTFIFPGYNSYAVRVLSDVSSCGAINVTDGGSVQDSSAPEEDEDTHSSGNIAVTVSSVCAVLGLIAAAVVVCVKCRRAIPSPGKKYSSK